MIKLGEATASTDQYKNTVDGLIGKMKTDGVKTAGKTFMAQSPVQVKGPTKYGGPGFSYTDLQAINEQAEASKAGFLPAIASETWSAIKGGVGHAVNLISAPFIQPIGSVKFQLTHNGQTRDEFFRKEYERTISNVNAQYHSLQGSPLSNEAYQKSLDDLNSWSGNAIDAAHKRWQDSKLMEYGYRDWDTGQYKAEATPKDVFNIIDGALTVGTLASGGGAKPEMMQLAKNGIFKTGGNFVTESFGKVLGKSVTTNIDNIVAKTIETIPGFRQYADRQIAKLGGDLAAKRFVSSAIAEVVINSPIRQMNMQAATQIVESVIKGEYLKKNGDGALGWLNSGAGQTVLMAGMMLEGGPIGFVLNKLSKYGKAAKILTFGDELVSEMNKISKLAGPDAEKYLQQYLDGSTGSRLDHMLRIASGAKNDALAAYRWLAAHPEKIPAFKSFVETVAGRGLDDSVYQAATAAILKDLAAAGKKVTIENFMSHLFNWQEAAQALHDATQTLVQKGVLEKGQRAVVVSISREVQDKILSDITKIMKNVKSTAGKLSHDELLQLRKNAVIEYIQKAQNKGVAWAQHDGFVKDLVDGVGAAERAFAGKKNLPNSIRGVFNVKETAVQVKGVPRKLANELAKRGYYVALPKHVENPFVGIAEAAGSKLESTLVSTPTNGVAKALGFAKEQDIQELSKLLGDDVAAVRGANPGFGVVGALLNKAGIGLRDTSKEAYKLISTNAADAIDSLNLRVSGTKALNELQEYAEKSRTITDLRMMTSNEIQKALQVGESAAKEVQKAIISSHLSIPLELRGLGDRIVDWTYKTPTLRGKALMGIYQRLQGAARYTYNPFFRLQETTETKLLGIAKANGDNLFASTFSRFNPQTRAYLDDVVKSMESHNILEATQYGEGATSGVLGRITANIGTMQKRDLASVVDAMAGKAGMTVDELLTNHTADVIDAIRPIVQYPKNGVINSNFMKFMNFAAFPSRYNVKVAKIAFETLAKQSPAVQAAVVRGSMNFGNWLNTNEGMAWRQDYAKEIAFIKWLTPLGNLDWTFRTLLGKNNVYSEFGMLGGLPLGVFTQILHDQGVIDNQAPFIDPKSGEVYSRRIPVTVKGRLASALMDMLGSTFTYPGRTLLLPGKTATLRDVAHNITGASGKDFKSIAPDMNKLDSNQKAAADFWKQRYATSRGATNTTLPVSPLPPQLPITPQAPSTKVPSKKRTAYEIRQAKLANKRSKASKQPVPFSNLVNR